MVPQSALSFRTLVPLNSTGQCFVLFCFYRGQLFYRWSLILDLSDFFFFMIRLRYIFGKNVGPWQKGGHALFTTPGIAGCVFTQVVYGGLKVLRAVSLWIFAFTWFLVSLGGRGGFLAERGNRETQPVLRDRKTNGGERTLSRTKWDKK